MKVEVQTGNREVIDFEDIDHVNCRIVAQPKADALLIRVGELGDCHSTYINKATIRALLPHLDKWLETGTLRVEEPAAEESCDTEWSARVNGRTAHHGVFHADAVITEERLATLEAWRESAEPLINRMVGVTLGASDAGKPKPPDVETGG